MLDYIKSCFKNKLLLETYNNYNNVWKEKPEFPYYNYFGVNFSEKELISVKFYFHVFRKITLDEAKLFLPTTEDFNKYYDMYEESLEQNIEHSGCAFELKFFPEMEEPVQGFHFRVKPTSESYGIIGLPRLIEFDWKVNNMHPGINYEYYRFEKLRKTYYYFNQKVDIDFFAEKFKLEFIKSARLIEYSESDSLSKINTWYGNSPELFSKANILEDAQKNFIDKLASQLNLTAKAFGFYENKDVKAIYLFANYRKPNDSELITNNTYCDTMKNLGGLSEVY